MHNKGRGVLGDEVEAYKWANIAVARGNKDAMKVKDILTKRMTSEQIAEAQKLNREWKPKITGKQCREMGLPFGLSDLFVAPFFLTDEVFQEYCSRG